MIPPAEWYSQQDLSKHYMRRTDRPFEEGVSRGQLRRIAKCEQEGMQFTSALPSKCYRIITDNRESKGRAYGMSMDDWIWLLYNMHAYSFQVGDYKAVAFCVVVGHNVLYISAWANTAASEKLSPVTLLCKGIHNWCAANGFDTLDIGIGGNEGLNRFKESLAFKLGVPC